MSSILVTGCAGFIGSNFVSYFLKKYSSYKLINLDKLTYAGNLNNIHDAIANPNHKFIKGDICNKSLLKNIFFKNKIKGVIHFAAESHVDNSIYESENFVDTNIKGTHNLIDVAFKSWMKGPFKYKKNFLNSKFLHVSTDEVYGSIEGKNKFNEKSPYKPNSPYAASKASSNMIVRSYNKTYGLNTSITCSSNNYGPKQHSEKLIPTIIKKALKLEKIPIYGDGKNVRDWIHVLDHCRAIDLVYHNGLPGHTYNIGGDYQITNRNLVFKVCNVIKKLKNKNENYFKLVKYVKDRPGHDKRYAIDCSKIKNDLGWHPKIKLDEEIFFTVKWYIEQYENKKK